jgi:hypothetical protein
VVKLNEGFSGEGNAVFSFEGLDPTLPALRLERSILDLLPERLAFEAEGETWDSYARDFLRMGGVVEVYVEGERIESPSVQCCVRPGGEVRVLSTHDQVLGGPSGQIFLGCTFPAAAEYRLGVQEAAIRVATEMARRGVIGRFGIDFLSILDQGAWRQVAVEINLRKGGTTHPFQALKYLTAGEYDARDGLFYAPSGRSKFYFATDTVRREAYKGLSPQDLVDLAVYHGLHFDGSTERGVVFHLIGALSEYGKVGIVAIGDNPMQARVLYEKTLQVLDDRTSARGRSS